MIESGAYHCAIISNLIGDDSVDNWYAGWVFLVLAFMRAPLLLIMVVVSAGVYGCEFLQCECCSDYVIMIV